MMDPRSQDTFRVQPQFLTRRRARRQTAPYDRTDAQITARFQYMPSKAHVLMGNPANLMDAQGQAYVRIGELDQHSRLMPWLKNVMQSFIYNEHTDVFYWVLSKPNESLQCPDVGTAVELKHASGLGSSIKVHVIHTHTLPKRKVGVVLFTHIKERVHDWAANKQQ